MANKVDIRIVKTKEKLKRTLVGLLKIKDIDEISISEVCAAAGINRNTFYSHYSDVKGLLNEVKAQYLELFIDQITSNAKYNGNFQKFMTLVLDNMKTNKEISSLLFGGEGGSVFLKTIVQFCFPEELKQLDFESSDITSTDIYQFLVGGTVCIIENWINDGFENSPENVGMKIAFFVQNFRFSFRKH